MADPSQINPRARLRATVRGTPRAASPGDSTTARAALGNGSTERPSGKHQAPISKASARRLPLRNAPASSCHAALGPAAGIATDAANCAEARPNESSSDGTARGTSSTGESAQGTTASATLPNTDQDAP